MNFVPYHIASGAAFFEGMVIATLGLFFMGRLKMRWPKAAARIAAILGMVIVVCSGTPMALWIYAVWLVLGLLVMARPQKVALVIFVWLSAGLCVKESLWRTMPRIDVRQGESIYVIGDSISAGLGQHEITWPLVLAQTGQLVVTNLAQPGATVQSAMGQLQGITRKPSIVLLEIGGNDLLGDAKVPDFRQQLEALLAKLNEEHERVVMFELPLLPLRNGFGEAQRELARKYHVTLIPKKCLVKVFGMKNGTMDGLHLSQDGHNALAALMREILVKEPTARR